jgi:hypothetical protein
MRLCQPAIPHAAEQESLRDEPYDRGRKDERAAIVAWLRAEIVGAKMRGRGHVNVDVLVEFGEHLKSVTRR